MSLVERPLGVVQATRAPQGPSVHCGVEGGTSAATEWWDGKVEIVQVEDLSVGCLA